MVELIADVILVSVVTVLAAATLIARIPTHWWWLRACEFPRLQLGLAALLCALASPLASPLLTPWLMIVALVVAIIQAGYVLPWTPLWPVQVKSAEDDVADRCLTLMVANVLTPNRNSDGLLKLVRDHEPDMLLTLESDDWWGSQLDEGLADSYPHAVRVPLDNLYGMHLYSRRPLHDTKVKWLIQDDIPSIHCGVELPSGEQIRFHALHPRPPAPSESEESLWRDAELMLVAKLIHQDPVPTLVAGDLNDVAWSRSTRLFCRVSGMLDPRRGRGLFASFHANIPLLRWPLDHVFVSEHFTLAHMERLPAFGSDHFPILARLCYRPARADEHDTPEAAPAEFRDARDTVEEAKERDEPS
ncbi:endonuclease/exonuclease/phosphatase family protein [Halomonas denitrificans]|uniref:endonuclease/exonuclease/phosphatase family protein n=1 Tax=Halomonas TaxID=2745 RepID=UPI001A8D48CA|nr:MULTISPECIES: endonuclease/exonuclease/phosphatase family protein [Halomonas]MED5294126.1 endonuclease/exonuclease/phosphatase family protein [Pseudomonadota bacterium]MBN8414292.1 endonuclease/exonuclease/phosphatase family protein [Halomonas litopenaei]MBY5930987.1 endonuclease/exonuclease/phosphatase family protein [Halomonas sp. DP8Y7-3]MBY5968890.1 endonuclease/exonuclease/phosphatase family protein [Halomonas denitrificans]MBY5984508.1 endonuclease/exonuclease/phosphatase family prote